MIGCVMYRAKKKRVLCFGDSNTWGRVPWSWWKQRYNEDVRRPCILQSKLGHDFHIIEEWLSARTTVFDDPRPELPMRNGKQMLSVLLETHTPLDYVVVMLWTTDTKKMLWLSAEEITAWMWELITLIKWAPIINGAKQPQIIIVAPLIVKDDALFALSLFEWSTQKMKAMVWLYQALADKENVLFVDPNSVTAVDQEEWVHLDENAHKVLWGLVAWKILTS